jgi:hypothetical protein
VISWLASLFILSVCLQEMESAQPCRPGLSIWRRLTEVARGFAWMALGMGAFVNVMKPFALPIQPSVFYDALPILGVAMVLLIYEVRHAGES